MAETKTLEDLKDLAQGGETVAAAAEGTLPEPKIDEIGRASCRERV